MHTHSPVQTQHMQEHQAGWPSSIDPSVKIQLLRSLNLVSIKGESMADSNQQYSQVLCFIDDHLSSHCHLTVFFKYDRFNCRSAAQIIKIIKKLNGYYLTGKNVSIQWNARVREGDMLEAGMDFKEFSVFPFIIFPN